MLLLCERLPYFDHLKSKISNLKSLAESIARQVRAWADCLQNSDIPGQRRLTDARRAEYQARNRAAAFWRQLDALRGNAPPDTGEETRPPS